VTLSKFNYAYDAVGNIETWTQQQDASPAMAYDFEYDRADQLRTGVFRTTDPTPAILKRYAYTYDPAGNRTVEQIDNAPVLSAYDNMNRITSQTPGGTMRFAGGLSEAATVAIQGNPASVTASNTFEGGAQVTSGTSQVVVTATDPAGNQRTNTYQVSVSGNSKTFTFDANGNMTGDGTRAFEWDAENRLLAVKQGSTTLASFTYNANGLRATKTAGGITSSYVYDGGHIAEERKTTGGTTRYFFGEAIDDVLATQDSTGAFYYAKDHLRSVRQVTNAAAEVIITRDYDPWGNVLGAGGSGFAFTGREWDSETGAYYYRARYYDPQIARFLSEDPIKADQRNLYVYVENRPLVRVDPLGLQSWSGNWEEWGVPPRSAFYVCCFKQKIAICRGPAYTDLHSESAKKCALQHENLHLPQFREDCRYKDYCSGKPDGFPVYYQDEGHMKKSECAAWKETAACIGDEWGDFPQQQIDRFCSPGAP
jgi:RHS repeat-associated protein